MQSWELDEHVSAEDAVLISEVRNAGQNTDLLNSEVHMIINIQRFCKAEEALASSRQIKVGVVCAKMQTQSFIRFI